MDAESHEWLDVVLKRESEDLIVSVKDEVVADVQDYFVEDKGVTFEVPCNDLGSVLQVASSDAMVEKAPEWFGKQVRQRGMILACTNRLRDL